MINLMRRHPRFFVYACAAAAALRLCCVLWFPVSFDDDTVYYAELGRNAFQYGTYGSLVDGTVIPTDVRLPGYPAFLAAVFAVFGDQHYRPVLLIQVLVDLGSCLLMAGIALVLMGEGAALAVLLLAALCPFTANYAAVALTETWSIFFTSLALWAAVKGNAVLRGGAGIGLSWWLVCGLAIGAATLLRPDGIMLLMALGVFLTWRLLRAPEKRQVLTAGTASALVVVLMLTPWTWRNWVTFHELQPLAPRNFTAPAEYSPVGFYRWYKTWPAEFATLYDVFWKVNSVAPAPEPIVLDEVPSLAWDTPPEGERTLALFRTLNETSQLSPELDAQFGALAAERIARDPLRYYLYLPVFRIADIWLRPRTEQFYDGERELLFDQYWWRFESVGQSLFSIGYALLNALLLAVAVMGMWSFRRAPGAGLLIGFVALRSAFLGTLENPEPRYVLECFPVILVFAGAQIEVMLRAVARAAGSRAAPGCGRPI
ncbi:glycosyltransferase family 39 protein [uncultured Thiodictyon sp.]|uniref:glycosyltransferase family 39 protein n=1 Tax=uncultured Thiodictyon sp. TaxID=1846217 RepID=UPI0025FA378F|nr:glycosyltransferase family 39 protein [uncultured Thiodictyon sp.]